MIYHVVAYTLLVNGTNLTLWTRWKTWAAFRYWYWKRKYNPKGCHVYMITYNQDGSIHRRKKEERV